MGIIQYIFNYDLFVWDEEEMDIKWESASLLAQLTENGFQLCFDLEVSDKYQETDCKCEAAKNQMGSTKTIANYG